MNWASLTSIISPKYSLSMWVFLLHNIKTEKKVKFAYITQKFINLTI